MKDSAFLPSLMPLGVFVLGLLHIGGHITLPFI